MYGRGAPPKSQTGLAILVFFLFLLIGGGGAAAFFFGRPFLESRLGGGATPPPPPTTIPAIPLPTPVATAQAPIPSVAGGSVVLPSGARVDVSPRALDADVGLTLSRVTVPKNVAGRTSARTEPISRSTRSRTRARRSKTRRAGMGLARTST